MSTESNQAPYAGRLGLTATADFQVTSRNGDTFPASLYTGVNLTKNPELRERLVADDFHRVTCPIHDDVFDLAVPVIVHDEDRRIFALLLPDALRHQEFEERRRLLSALEAQPEGLPAYVREFRTIFQLSQLDELPEGDRETTERPKLAAPQNLEAHKEMARQRSSLEDEENRLKVERAQLDEVRERFDRERGQMDEFESRIAREREELEALRSEVEKERMALQAEKLNAEAREIGAEPSVASDEATQVVTDDQFIEIMGEEPALDEESELAFEPLMSGVPQRFEDVAGKKPKSDAIVKIVDDGVLAAARAERKTIAAIFNEPPVVFTQLHTIDNYPVIGLVLAHLDAQGQTTESVAWALDVADSSHGMILDRLEKTFALKTGLYKNTDATLFRAAEIAAPLSSNLRWIRTEAARRLKELGTKKGKFEKSAAKFVSPDFERVGGMRHSFEQHSFNELDTPSEVKLAAGIVGFWSTEEKFAYLIGNRAFPLAYFRAIQERVTRAAVENGIYLNEPLRDIAIELEIARDEDALVDTLMANFAEVCISIRSNDLDAAEQWDNWDALLGLGDDLGVPPDPDVVELAEVSLRRAQEMSELEEIANEPTQMTDVASMVQRDHTLVVAKQSESTGVTYFLPEDAIVDSFDDLASMPREDLELLLKDAKGRLEAAQMLLERFGGTSAATVFEASEEMTAAEVAALAKFVETKADGLEGELVRCVENGGPSTTYIVATGLASIKSTTGLPVLLEALVDPKRQGDYEKLARALAEYGDKLLPSLTRAIKQDGADEPFVVLLASLEDHAEGTLNQLSKDRSKALREVARRARERRDRR